MWAVGVGSMRSCENDVKANGVEHIFKSKAFNTRGSAAASACPEDRTSIPRQLQIVRELTIKSSESSEQRQLEQAGVRAPLFVPVVFAPFAFCCRRVRAVQKSKIIRSSYFSYQRPVRHFPTQ